MIAYIDPGIGGLIIQTIAVIIGTTIIFCRNSIKRVFGGLKSLFVKKENPSKQP